MTAKDHFFSSKNLAESGFFSYFCKRKRKTRMSHINPCNYLFLCSISSIDRLISLIQYHNILIHNTLKAPTP